MSTETTAPPPTGPCARCGQTRPLFPADPGWGDVPSPLCTTDWQQYAEARASGSYFDWNDAFANASDAEIEAQFAEGAR